MRSAPANHYLPAIRGDDAGQDRRPPAQLAASLSGSELVLEAKKTRQDESNTTTFGYEPKLDFPWSLHHYWCVVL